MPKMATETYVASAVPTVVSTTPPASHTHAQSDVTNLVSALAGKRSTPVFTTLANDTLAQNYAVNDVTKLTVTANRTLTTTVPPAGYEKRTVILTSGASSFTITFGSGFKPTGTLATGTTTARLFVVTWVSDGTNLLECSRTAAFPA